MSNEVKIELTGSESKLLSSLNRGVQGVRTYAGRTMGIFKQINASVVSGYSKLGTMGQFGVALGLYETGKGVIDLNASLAHTAIQANVGASQMLKLKQQLFEVAQQTHQSPTELLQGVDAIVKRTGNFQFATDSLKEMGIIASVTGARMEDIGAAASNMQEKMGLSADQILPMFDVLTLQGKKGAFTVQDMANQFERLLSAANRMNVHGMQGMREFGAFLQLARRGAGSAEETATSVENVIGSITGKQQELLGFGIKLFNQEETRKTGKMVYNDFDNILKQIIVKSNGNAMILSKIFGETGIRAITPLVQSWKKFGDFRELKQFAEYGGNGATIIKDFAFWSDQTAAKLQDLRSALSKVSNEQLDLPIKELTKALQFLNDHPALTKVTLGTTGLTVAMMGAWVAGSKLLSMLKAIAGLGATLGEAGIWAFLTEWALPAGMAGAAGYEVGKYVNKGLGWTSGKLTHGKYKGEGWLGNYIYDATHPSQNLLTNARKDTSAPVQNNINLEVHVTKDLIYSNITGSNFDTKLNAKRGRFDPTRTENGQ